MSAFGKSCRSSSINSDTACTFGSELSHPAFYPLLSATGVARFTGGQGQGAHARSHEDRAYLFYIHRQEVCKPFVLFLIFQNFRYLIFIFYFGENK